MFKIVIKLILLVFLGWIFLFASVATCANAIGGDAAENAAILTFLIINLFILLGLIDLRWKWSKWVFSPVVTIILSISLFPNFNIEKPSGLVLISMFVVYIIIVCSSSKLFARMSGKSTKKNETGNFDYGIIFPDEEISSNGITSIDGMDGHKFEYFCADLLRKNGFTDVSVTPGSGDQGIDILAEKGGVKYAIQCKNYTSPLSNTPVQEAGTGKIFYNCHVGVVMTNSTFTPRAKELAKATGVLLWDRTVVQEMMKS